MEWTFNCILSSFFEVFQETKSQACRSDAPEVLDTVFDMETGDPDDILSLYLLLGHPRVNLKAVTVHPGSPEQIGLVREILTEMRGIDCNIAVGYHNIEHKKRCVSGWYRKNGFIIAPSRDAVPAGPLLLDIVTPSTIIITGGALTNLGSAIDLSEQQGKKFAPLKIVMQGGFAGCNMVAPEDVMKKFAGLESLATYNLNGNLNAAKTVLALKEVPKYFVSKNVCHSIMYTVMLAERCKQSKAPHVQRLVALLEHYNGRDKKLHDPFAVCCALSPDIVKWRQATLSCVKESRGYEWRSDPVDESESQNNTWISVGIQDYELFVKTFLEA